MSTWIPPDEYPYIDRNPREFCFLWHHGKIVVRLINLAGRLVERYDCRCGKFYWLSQENGQRPLVKHRTR